MRCEKSAPSPRKVRNAALRSDPAAILMFGIMLHPCGDPPTRIPKNAYASLRWLKKALARRQYQANAWLGYSLFHGWGTESKPDEGMRRLNAAASRG